MKNRSTFMKYGSGFTLSALASQSHAAVPAEVTTAITTMATDGVTVAAAVLVAIIGVVAIKFIRKGL